MLLQPFPANLNCVFYRFNCICLHVFHAKWYEHKPCCSYSKIFDRLHLTFIFLCFSFLFFFSSFSHFPFGLRFQLDSLIYEIRILCVDIFRSLLTCYIHSKFSNVHGTHTRYECFDFGISFLEL